MCSCIGSCPRLTCLNQRHRRLGGARDRSLRDSCDTPQDCGDIVLTKIDPAELGQRVRRQIVSHGTSKNSACSHAPPEWRATRSLPRGSQS